jgi:hypothetical protein
MKIELLQKMIMIRMNNPSIFKNKSVDLKRQESLIIEYNNFIVVYSFNAILIIQS